MKTGHSYFRIIVCVIAANSDMYTSVEQKTNEDAMNLVNEARQKMKSLKMKF